MQPPRDLSSGQGRSNPSRAAHAAAPARGKSALTSRRDVLRQGARLAYVTPIVLSLSAQQALAGSIPSGMCSTGQHTGQPCFTDTDCCSGKCDFGVCD